MWLHFWEKDLTDSKSWVGHQVARTAIQERSYGDLNSNNENADGKKWTELIKIPQLKYWVEGMKAKKSGQGCCLGYSW